MVFARCVGGVAKAWLKLPVKVPEKLRAVGMPAQEHARPGCSAAISGRLLAIGSGTWSDPCGLRAAFGGRFQRGILPRAAEHRRRDGDRPNFVQFGLKMLLET